MSDKMYKELLDNIPGCIALILKKHTREIVAANKKAREIGAVPGETCFVHCSLRETFCPWCLAPTLWEGNEPQKCEIEYEGKCYEGVWAPLSQDLYVHYIFDITERKNAEEEREALIVQLQEKNVEKERFVYTVSHDLKTPLVTISGFCEMAKMGLASEDQEQCNKSLDIISKAAKRMQQLIDELLQISRVGVKINPKETVNLESLIKDAIGSASGLISANNSTIEIESELPDVKVDRQYFLQAIENLLANASRYSRSANGGSNIKIGVTRSSEELTCYVKDNGIGLEAQYLEKVFGLFERVDLNSDSTGVGLAIVKRIIEAHGGRIWVESEGLGHGTTFFFTLPEA